MELPKSTIRKLDLMGAAKAATAIPLDHLPLLIGDECLTGNESELVKATATGYEAGRIVETETISMPRQGFGPRPVTVLSPVDRTMYVALTGALAPTLPEPTRGPGKYKTFTSFGMPGTSTETHYVVTIDIAAAYEYVDHGTLRNELILHTMDVSLADSVVALLEGAFGRPRGLPQMLAPSDLLADTYLAAIERSLQRRGHLVARYADDFRVLAENWGIANEIIEEAASVARRYGLVLSSEKTKIQKAATLQAREKEHESFVQNYFDKAKGDLVDFDYIIGPYEDVDTVEIPPEDKEAFEEAYRNILQDWAKNPAEAALHFASAIGAALSALENATDPLPGSLLEKIAFYQPVRLDAVAEYIVKREEVELQWQTLRSLVAMERQGPWTKLWLLWLGEKLSVLEGEHSEVVMAWAIEQIGDQHELVRAQAAWLLSGRSLITPTQLADLYSPATTLSRPALAACLGRLGEPATSQVAKAFIGDSRLSGKAFAWGAAFA
ncbi:RNA-directed DNA polymerase [Salinibacterium sp. PAMC 21357]|uniref:RNA-directed DNA polymerase n=1 Tax=Salinibacterium sp. PAMC 21357 TaxID=1112215 RepID=UPI00028A13E6|nr:RNA-directed DNA polymerase [Salinibacterium sp. PAMC 21357]